MLNIQMQQGCMCILTLKCEYKRACPESLGLILMRKNDILKTFYEFGYVVRFSKLNDDLSFDLRINSDISLELLKKFMAYFDKEFDVEMSIVE